jgi:hypothetical protein
LWEQLQRRSHNVAQLLPVDVEEPEAFIVPSSLVEEKADTLFDDHESQIELCSDRRSPFVAKMTQQLLYNVSVDVGELSLHAAHLARETGYYGA